MKKYLLNIICLFLIIFVSTPAVVFQTLQSIGANHIETRIIEKLPFIKYLPQSTSTLIILIINILILVMIDQLAIAEKHHQHSKYQTSIFHKATVYLHLNMVVLPFLGFQESSIYQAMKTDRGFKDYFNDLSMIDTTPKFVLLVLQFAVFGGWFYLLRIGLITFFKFSPSLTDYMYRQFSDKQPWRRRPEHAFQYGYFYSQIVTVFTITVLFSSIAPLVVMMWIFFFGFRHFIDAHWLLSVHKTEIHSGIQLFQKVLSALLFSLTYYHICLIIYLYLKRLKIQLCIVLSMLILTLLILFTINTEDHSIKLIKKYMKIEERRNDQAIDISKVSLF